MGWVQGTNGQSADSFRFAIRKQLTSHLCMRLPNKQTGRQATKRGYGATVHAEGEEDDEFGFVTLVRNWLWWTIYSLLALCIVSSSRLYLQFEPTNIT